MPSLNPFLNLLRTWERCLILPVPVVLLLRALTDQPYLKKFTDWIGFHVVGRTFLLLLLNCSVPVRQGLAYTYFLPLAWGYPQGAQIFFWMWKATLPQRWHSVCVLLRRLPNELVPFVWNARRKTALLDSILYSKQEDTLFQP